MKVTKQELISFGLFDTLPDELKNLEDRNYYVIYYEVIEEESKLNIVSSEIVVDVNINLFRTLNDVIIQARKPLNVAYFSNTFETRDGIFYQLLRTYNDVHKVREFYSFAVEQDRIVDINVSTSAIPEIYTSDDFRRAISYFCQNRLQIIMQIYDMVNDSMKNKLARTLYGDSLKKVVNLIKYDGGVLPEIGGTLRFMVIGQKAKLTDEQTKNLKEAKELLRMLVPIDKIYAITGWAFGKSDGRWRTNIADNEAKIKDDFLQDYEGRKLFVPAGMNIAEVLPFIKNPKYMTAGLYKGRLNNLFYHPTLYNYYPQLALMPISYFFGEKYIQNGRYYFSPDARGGFIYMNGSVQSGAGISILLHEIQHYIQHQEGFATGGNEFLAQFVASVGSNSVRKIFTCINKMERYFREYLFDETSRLELLDIIADSTPITREAKPIKTLLLENLNNKDDYKNQYKTTNFYLVLYVAEQGDFSTNEVVSYLESKVPYPDLINELFDNIENGYQEAKKYREKLISQDYREVDVKNILFKSYENLYGEMESRSVQESRFVESEFRNYFYLTKWENTPLQQLTVIDGSEEFIDFQYIKAAVETKDKEYVLHFQRENECTPYLHELGHIVHDCLSQLGHEEEILKEFDDDTSYNDYDEWFVDKFMAYLKAKINNEYLQSDLMYFLIKPNNVLNKMLDDFFSETEITSRLRYLQTILSLQ